MSESSWDALGVLVETMSDQALDADRQLRRRALNVPLSQRDHPKLWR